VIQPCVPDATLVWCHPTPCHDRGDSLSLPAEVRPRDARRSAQVPFPISLW
jgi:hypothetical protein